MWFAISLIVFASAIGFMEWLIGIIGMRIVRAPIDFDHLYRLIPSSCSE